MALYNNRSGQDSDKFSTHGGPILVHTLDKTLLCGIPCTVLSWHKGSKGRENHVAKDLDGAFFRLCLFLSQLVAVGIAYRKGGCSFTLYIYAFRWLYLSADGRRMDEPTTQKQPDGRCV